ncbi:unnamed protein product [Leptidea sinapis]|uniref:TM7S3/TM198-like domain-containing protein n=1 Tax=Leptidea sinapis TaxID=189913 RepID=A0A5E4QV18_9NEOP|nr:unnamed protein product [Leptidea sinapis]
MIMTKLVLFITIITLKIVLSQTQNAILTVYLNKSTTWENKELYSGFTKLNNNSTLEVDCVNLNSNISYVIFQAHSHLYNITLYNNTYVYGSYVKGTNVGLYSSIKPTIDTFFVMNSNAIDLDVYISIHGYSAKDPTPGGCNAEFSVPISPFLQTKYNKDYVLVDAAFPQDILDKNCNSLERVRVAFYQMYIYERNFSKEAYFDGIQKMMTMEYISDNGVFIPDNGLNMRRMLSAYPGTGSIYVAVAFSVANKSAYSVYVPTVSYACSPLEENGCVIFDDALSQLLCASLLFIGTFICYFGHRFFKTEMFLVGLASGGIVTFILISLIADLNRPALLGASLLCGICFGSMWLLFYWLYGIPLVSVFLATLNVGFLFSALIYHGLPGGHRALEDDANFWTLFIVLMLLTSLVLVSMTFVSNILCCSLLGAYAAVYPIDYYLGSNLKYIIINTVRRAVVPNFNHAVLSPPFEWRDSLVTLLCVGLAISGFLVQHYQNYGRPPFPPPPRSVRPVPVTIYGATVPSTERRPVTSRNSRSRVITERTALLA